MLINMGTLNYMLGQVRTDDTSLLWLNPAIFKEFPDYQKDDNVKKQKQY